MQLVDDAPISNSQPVAIASLKLGHVVVTGVRIGGDSFDLLQNPLLPVHRKPGKGFGEGFCSDDLVHQSIVTISNNNSQPENLGPPALFITFFSYGPHRHRIAIVQQFPDSAASKTAPVSRDGPKIRRKTIFGGSLTSRR